MNILLTMTLRANLAHDERVPELEMNWNTLSRAEQSKRAQTRASIAEKAVTEDRARRFNTQRPRIPGEKVECQGIST